MKLWKARIFQNSLFKQAKFLTGTPMRSQTCFIVSEPRTLAIEMLPMDTGYTLAESTKQAWNVIHPLLVPMEGQEAPVLPITERSRYPLDPFDKFSSEERTSLADVKAVGREQYKEYYSRIGDDLKESQNVRLVKTVLWLSAILIVIIITILVIRR